ncbi:Spo24p Ecym_4665 [Eremothecium cymbalariae DBVPG|uniref:Uncharacterized protein n=1 Tax=Eremothecium cymbalariae (strain CBS 270.75 / DBVPG 7215 / KCTC 17166 / NRRL Y-17582) TaxID=931890 RepID=G8JSG4_ERECY|nr:hypothetical protein Ecym_4665 [Eremothecium cymbalariae DBVPG\
MKFLILTPEESLPFVIPSLSPVTPSGSSSRKDSFGSTCDECCAHRRKDSSASSLQLQ